MVEHRSPKPTVGGSSPFSPAFHGVFMKYFDNAVNFIKDIVSEMKVIDWASKSEVRSFSIIVFVMLIIFAIFFIIVDFSIMYLITKILS